MVLYSDGWESEKTEGLQPNEPSYIFFPSQYFYNREQSALRGFEIQGILDFKKLQYSHPGQLAVPRGRWSSISPWNTKAQMPPLVPRR